MGMARCGGAQTSWASLRSGWGGISEGVSGARARPASSGNADAASRLLHHDQGGGVRPGLGDLFEAGLAEGEERRRKGVGVGGGGADDGREEGGAHGVAPARVEDVAV